MSHLDRSVLDHQFEAELKDQEQKSAHLRDKIHAENKMKQEKHHRIDQRDKR